MVIPTYWARERSVGWKEGDAIYDHPTPLDSEGTLLRALKSIRVLNLVHKIIVGVLVLLLMIMPTIATYEVKYSAISEDGRAALKVTVRGPAESLEIILSDPDGNTVGRRYIPEEDLVDGVETVEVDMARYGETPKRGTYTLVVKTLYPEEKIYEANPTFKGAKLNITKAEYETEYLLGSWDIRKLKLTISNDGDLPAIIDKIVIKAGGKEEDLPILKGISPGEEKTISKTLWISGLEKGKHPVTVELYSKDNKLTSYTSEIICGAPEQTPTPKPAGFELVFAIVGLMAMILLRGRYA